MEFPSLPTLLVWTYRVPVRKGIHTMVGSEGLHALPVGMKGWQKELANPDTPQERREVLTGLLAAIETTARMRGKTVILQNGPEEDQKEQASYTMPGSEGCMLFKLRKATLKPRPRLRLMECGVQDNHKLEPRTEEKNEKIMSSEGLEANDEARKRQRSRKPSDWRRRPVVLARRKSWKKSHDENVKKITVEKMRNQLR